MNQNWSNVGASRIGYWPLKHGEGNVLYDGSGNGNDGDLNAVVWTLDTPFECPFLCGNGATEGEETCDDGNTSSGDGCNATCSSDESWGNDYLDPGEVCDDGNLRSGDGCNADCSSDESCGNDYLDPGEACDDGDLSSNDGCNAGCSSDESCGNDYLDPGEVCDDGNGIAADACTTDCVPATCGDGILRGDVAEGLRDFEACDDGNSSDSDACLITCKLSSCGDGIVQAGEACDDGNTDGGDGCASTCKLQSQGIDCTDIHVNEPTLPDGTYVIDSDGDGGNSAFEVYCDMTNDGGGWTAMTTDFLACMTSEPDRKTHV